MRTWKWFPNALRHRGKKARPPTGIFLYAVVAEFVVIVAYTVPRTESSSVKA